MKLLQRSIRKSRSGNHLRKIGSKPNWDVAINSHAKIIGLGGIIRDSFGKILASFCCRSAFGNNPEVVEVLPFKKTMLIYSDMRFQYIAFEDDC